MANFNGRSRVVIGVLLATMIVGCGPEFDPASKLRSLRVLAIKKDDPYARATKPDATDNATDSDYKPDNVVELTVALEDARRKSERLGTLQKLWFAGCSNPYGDTYFACLPVIWLTYKAYEFFQPELNDDTPTWGLADAYEEDSAAVLKFVTDTFPELSAQVTNGAREVSDEDREMLIQQALALRIGVGDSFRYEIPPWLIETHTPSADKDIPNYGLSQIYLAVCDGKVGLSEEWQGDIDLFTVMSDATMGFPLTCYDPETETERGPDNFMVSYSNVFAYEELTNRNPVISGIKFDGKAVDRSALCIGKACELYLDACDNPKAPRVPRCEEDKAEDCDTIKVLPVLSEKANSEVDAIATIAGSSGGDLLEQMWIRYYADRGDIRTEVKRLQDATEGWFADHGTKWEVPRSAGSAMLWAVAYDNRGGVDFARLAVCVED